MSKYVVLKLYLLNVVLTLHTTKKYWRSAGIRRTKSSRIQKLSKCFFRLSNLGKKQYEKQLRNILTEFQSMTNPRILQNRCCTTFLLLVV